MRARVPQIAGAARDADIAFNLAHRSLQPLGSIPAMKPATQPSALLQTKWHEYLSRFVIGGVVTALAGVIAQKYGPVLGGLFLAFPSIFPASATLIEKHEKRREERNAVSAQMQGRKAVEMDAFGAAMGALGLLAFALLAWRLMPVLAPWLVLTGSAVAWFLVSILVWHLWESFSRHKDAN